MAESLTVEALKKRLADLQAIATQLNANLQAQNGAIQFCEHLIKVAEESAATPPPPPDEGPK
jgi:hypothetical protein